MYFDIKIIQITYSYIITTIAYFTVYTGMWISLIKHSTCNANGFLYPLQTKFGRIYMNHLVHWLMQLCTVHIFIMELHYNLLLYTKIVYNLMVHYLCLVYTCLMEKNWKFPLHTNIRMCHGFEPRSFTQVQGRWK